VLFFSNRNDESGNDEIGQNDQTWITTGSTGTTAGSILDLKILLDL
jgi:hypothetical protein